MNKIILAVLLSSTLFLSIHTASYAGQKTLSIARNAGINKPALEYAGMTVTWPPKRKGKKETVRYFDEFGWSHDIRKTEAGDSYFTVKRNGREHAIYGSPEGQFGGIEAGLLNNAKTAKMLSSIANHISKADKQDCFDYVANGLLDPTSFKVTAPLRFPEKDIARKLHKGIYFTGKMLARNRGGNIAPAKLYCYYDTKPGGLKFRTGFSLN